MSATPEEFNAEIRHLNKEGARLERERDEARAEIQRLHEIMKEARASLVETLAECDRMTQEGIRERGRAALEKLQLEDKQ